VTGPLSSNREGEAPSIFSTYFTPAEFVDRYQRDRDRAVDVIIPIIHTNEIWSVNLLSIYREIPVARLILGDGGCIDGSLEIARKFPRVEVLDHRGFTSLGYSIRRLIEATEMEWFVYLHSDVFLPPGWFDAMSAHGSEYDWFESYQRLTILADCPFNTAHQKRAYSGSQMGRRLPMQQVVKSIDDDFLYRNEDIILGSLATRAGLRYGKVPETFCYHQLMHKPSPWRRAVRRVDIDMDVGRDEEVRAHNTYARGIIKYLDPVGASDGIIKSVRFAMRRLIELEATTAAELRYWIGNTSPNWLPHVDVKNLTSETLARRDRRADHVIAMAEYYRSRGGAETIREYLWRAMRRCCLKMQRYWPEGRRSRRKLSRDT
jgi:hypothetical protein